ncbi:hypothetical protein LZ198_08010 [Myxococcus sp. K15C18031901]|uniref:hypothetical protein n=1 Tax=Myxococcus dinghuensis TaxID=2906761 RepID=UPI0020A71CF7|nr:hypothetical protein [Myxococcus dinghuensis]MCP3098818.1 hypothetical protein [Myxococcus dinghuensis]
MNRIARNILAVGLLLVSSSALASEQWADGRAVLHSCVYASSYEAEVRMSYRNFTLPWGTSVYLIHGWGGMSNGVAIDWDNTQTVEAPASAPWTWTTTVRSTISTRSGTKWYTHFDYVWKVVLPDGNVFYEKGNGSTFGYYSANLQDITERPCTSDSSFIGAPFALTITSIEKW